MKIAVINASSQAGKNEMLCETVKEHAKDHQVMNFGCREDEEERYSYIEISILIGFLLSSGSVDFVVTGCSSGQGMMLACNSMPGVICGYLPDQRRECGLASVRRRVHVGGRREPERNHTCRLLGALRSGISEKRGGT